MAIVKGTTRQRVLDLVVRRPGASSAQIGRALRLSPAAVRHHLRILRTEGRIVSDGASKGASRGRPPESYRPSAMLLGDNLGLISDRLLRAWPRDQDASAPPEMIAALAEGLLQQLGPVAAGGALAGRLADLVAALDGAHYHARWEAGSEGPRIILGHCPYEAILEAHPELCLMDQQALALYTDTDATQLARIDVRGHSVNQCVFALRHAGRPAVKP
jgi:predicted ArsR family transcriptional regulator